MSCVGKELVEDAAKGPIVDTVEANDLVTSAAILHVSTTRKENISIVDALHYTTRAWQYFFPPWFLESLVFFLHGLKEVYLERDVITGTKIF